MKTLLTFLILFLILDRVASAENVNERLNKIEKRLDKIEELLKPLIDLQRVSNSLNSIPDNKETVKLKECIKINDSKSSIIDDNRNNKYLSSVEISWKISYSNSCDKDIYGEPSFSFSDKNGLLLEEAMIFDYILIPAKGSKEARGTHTIISKEKINRLHSTQAGLKDLKFR